MKYWLGLFLGLVVVMLLYNLEDYLSSPTASSQPQDYTAIDYYLTDFSLSAVTATGAVSHTLSGHYLAYSQDRQSSFIANPRLASKDQSGQQGLDSVVLTAGEAVLDHTHNQLQLNGKVRLQVTSQANTQGKPPDLTRPPLDLKTDYLLYHFADRRIETAAPVQINSPQLDLSGVGLEAKLDETTLKVNAHVKSTYQPAR